jgi:hypothetical protein
MDAMLLSGGRVLKAAWLPTVMALLTAALMGGGAQASVIVPVYSATAAPPTGAAGTTGAFTVTLTQLVPVGSEHEYDTRELGSASIASPSGFTVLGASTSRGSASVAGNTVTVEDLELHDVGQTATVTIQASIACGTSGAAAWTVIGHQTDHYADGHAYVQPQSSASQLSVTVNPCQLAFAAGRQPADAQVNTNITSEPANPAGLPVQVQLLDGNGAALGQAGLTVGLGVAAGTGTPGAILGGTTSVITDAAGLATFSTLSLDRSGHGYQLQATAAPGITAATSDAFDVDDVLTKCTGNCSGTATGTTTTATVNLGQAAGAVLGLSLGVDPLSCNDSANHFYVDSSQVLTFDASGTSNRKIVTLVLAKANVTKSFLRYQVCFSSPTIGFTNLYGVAIPPGSAGLLPLCWKPNDLLHSPCVLLKGVDLHGNVFAIFLAPPGDPRGRI